MSTAMHEREVERERGRVGERGGRERESSTMHIISFFFLSLSLSLQCICCEFSWPRVSQNHLPEHLSWPRVSGLLLADPAKCRATG